MFEANSTRFIKALILTLCLGLCLGVVAMNLFDPARGARLTMLERDHSRMTGVNARLARDNARLERELRSLEEGAAGWRDVARREHGMILDGEVVFRFPVAAE